MLMYISRRTLGFQKVWGPSRETCAGGSRRIISYTRGSVHQCTAADVIINPSAPFSAGGVVVVVCMRKRNVRKNKIKKERSGGGGKETETSLGGVGWGSGGGPYGWIRFLYAPQQVLL
jgi:hypothetical protein